MLIRRLGILCYLLLPPSKVVAVFKELVRLLMLWFLQRNSANVFYQLSFLQTKEKKNKLLFLFMALIWNRHLCEHCFLLSLNKTWCKHENMYFTAQSRAQWPLGTERAPDVLQGGAGGWIEEQKAVPCLRELCVQVCLYWPSWDRAWRGLLRSLSWQSSSYCSASETEKSWVKFHTIKKK